MDTSGCITLQCLRHLAGRCFYNYFFVICRLCSPVYYSNFLVFILLSDAFVIEHHPVYFHFKISHFPERCCQCFFQLHQLQRLRRSLDDETVAVLVHAFITSHVNYSSCLQAGALKSTTEKFQRIMNVAAWLLTGTRKFDRGLMYLQPHFLLVGRQWSDKIPSVCHCLQCVYAEWHLVIYQSCADQFPHFKDDVTCVLPVSAILAFLVSDVTLTENGYLPTLAHLLGTHYLTI